MPTVVRRSASSSSSRSASVRLDVARPTAIGLVSVIPHACRIGQADLLAVALRQRPRHRRAAARDGAQGRWCRGPSSSGQHAHPDGGHAGGDRDLLLHDEVGDRRRAKGRGPGITRSAPAATAACASPHALAWNIGTTGRMMSRLADAERVDRHARRWCAGRSTGGVDDALRVARGAARVTHRRGAVLVVDVEVDRLGRRPAGPRSRSSSMPVGSVGDLALAVVHHHEMAHGLERRQQRPQQAGERAVDEDDLVLGVVDDVGELLGEQPDVERVQHAAGARRREVQLEVARRVPAERGDPPVGSRCRASSRTPPSRRVRSRPLAVRRALEPVAVAVVTRLVAESCSARSKRWTQRERVVLHQTVHRCPPVE